MIQRLQLILIAVFLLAEVQGYELPPGFRDLRMGMEWKELIQSRPNLTIFAIDPDPIFGYTPNPENPEPEEIVGEIINSGPIKAVLYTFYEGRLGSMSFVYRSESEIGDRLLTEFLERYGKYEDILSAVGTGNGLVKWIVGSYNLYLTIPFERGDDLNETVAYQIMDMRTDREFELLRNTELEKKLEDQDGLHVLESRVLALSDVVLSRENEKPLEKAVEKSEPTEQHRSQPEPEPKDAVKDKPEVEANEGEIDGTDNLPYVLLGLLTILLAIALIRKVGKR